MIKPHNSCHALQDYASIVPVHLYCSPTEFVYTRLNAFFHIDDFLGRDP